MHLCHSWRIRFAKLYIERCKYGVVSDLYREISQAEDPLCCFAGPSTVLEELIQNLPLEITRVMLGFSLAQAKRDWA